MIFSLDEHCISWIPEERKFVGMAAELFRYGVPRDFSLKNPKTGGVVNFKQTKWERNRDGDVICWNYWCESHNLNMVVYND